MAEKKKSIITQITLNTPTYKNQIINDLSYVNFFYGGNGTGKSTLAAELTNHTNLSYNMEGSFGDFDVYLYNSEFVKNNFTLKDKLRAIYTLGKVNIEKQTKIAEYKDLIKKNKKDIETAKAAHETATKSKATIIKGFQDLCWKNTKTQREFFSKNITGMLRGKEDFIAKVINAFKTATTENPLISDYEGLVKTSNTAFGGDNTIYPELKFPLPIIPNKDTLLSTSLTSSDSTEFARFVKALNNTSWLKDGHDKYHTEDGKCPYCQRELQSDFEEQYKSCFDEDYQRSVDELKAFYKDYEAMLSDFLTSSSENFDNIMPSLDMEDYKKSIDTIEAKFRYNLKLIQDKINNPDIKITLDDVSKEVTILTGMIFVKNKIIKEHNNITNNKDKIKSQLNVDIYRYFAYQLTNEIQTNEASMVAIDASITSSETTINTLEKQNHDYQEEIKTLSDNTVSAEPVVIRINEAIKHSGFQGFHLEWNENDKGSYQVVYNTKDAKGNFIPAVKLSEGETNFIAFLYFYFWVVNTDESGEPRDAVVVIDDPVSSMDSQTLFIVSSLVKNLIDRCINASSIDAHGAIEENNVIQMFILTHNVYFHANITPEYENNYEAVNFYQISKSGNQSRIKLRIKQNHDGTYSNVNPIKNSYAALWRELDEVETSISACNIIHRILGYYFINLCGYTNKNLTDELLNNPDNVAKFLKDENGNDTQDRYNLVRSFLEYLDHSQNVVGNEVYFVDGMDVQTVRETFKMVFDAMKQTQHYIMMTNQK